MSSLNDPNESTNMVPVVLTIAGSDSSGGAGIQADLRTFAALGVYGMSVVTAVTAQNSREVKAVFDVGPHAIGSQIDAVMADATPDSIKVGMLHSAKNIRAVVQSLGEYKTGPLVLDPVHVSSSGTSLLSEDGLRLVRDVLLPLCSLVSPNLDEAEALTQNQVRSVPQMKEAAEILHAMGASHVLITGGHLQTPLATDVYFDGTSPLTIEEPRIPDRVTHGSGCVLSAAIAGYLALGIDMETAVRQAKSFAAQAIRNRLTFGEGRDVSNAAWSLDSSR